MSYYSIFDEQEPVVTSTSTGGTILQSADIILVHSTVSGRKAQSTIGSAQSLAAVTFATTAQSTTTFVSPYGTTIFKSTGGSSAVWVLSDPPTVGLIKTLVFGSSSTSTNFGIVPQSATISAPQVAASSLVNLGSTGTSQNWGNSATLTAQTTSLWVVTAHSSTIAWS